MKVKINWNELLKYPINSRIKTKHEDFKYPYIQKSRWHKINLYFSRGDWLLWGSKPIATITFSSKSLRDYMYEFERGKIYEAFLKEYEKTLKLMTDYKEKLLDEKYYYYRDPDDPPVLIKILKLLLGGD